MADQMMDKCDFCQEVKIVERTYLYPSKYEKPLDESKYLLYNEGDYFVMIHSCNECGKPKI